MLAVIRSTRSIGALVALVITGMFATQTVTIAPGDTLSELAARHGVALTDLMDWNDIVDADFIVAGDTLLVTMESSAGSPTTYVVQGGDTLTALAGRFGSTVGALVAANGLSDPDHIVVGQTLALSADSDEGSGSASLGSASTYTVQLGDTLLEIARANGLKTTDLVNANGLADPDRIFAGQLLTIPGEPSPVTAPSTTVPPATPTTTVPPTTPTTTVPPQPTPPPTTSTLAPPPLPAPPTTTVPPPTTTAPTPVPDTSAALAGYFDKWATAYGVDRGLLEALLWKESNWRADAVGPGGHLGIGQLSPDTAAFIEERLLGLDLDPLDASDGIQMAARFLRYLLDRTDDDRTALAAWNQGLHGVTTGGISAAAGAFADDVLAIRRQRA